MANNLKTSLHELRYIDKYNGNKAPFLILSGRGCDECDANISIYICSPGDVPLKVKNGEIVIRYREMNGILIIKIYS
jgi:hypothetical protein